MKQGSVSTVSDSIFYFEKGINFSLFYQYHSGSL